MDTLRCPECGYEANEMDFAFRSWSCRQCGYEISYGERDELVIGP